MRGATMSFDSLGLDPRLLTALAELNYAEPTTIQQQAIPAILAGKDIMAGAQTGTGKTAAFSLPVLHTLLQSPINGSTGIRMLVLTPTRELAQQVHASIVGYSQHTPLRASLVYGGVSLTPQLADLAKHPDILVATPGRLLDHMSKGSIKLDQITHLVFDEADRMLDMGFIHDINRILKHTPEQLQTLLFSATLDEAIMQLSQRLLTDPELIESHARNTAAAEVEQIVYQVDDDRKRELISHLIGARNWHQVLIFTRTKQGADALAKEMCKDGINSQSIHGDKSQGAREKALADFKSGKVRALIATDVASRGLDIPQLEYVINFELPYIAEDYIHRIGRTGRAGSKGIAISLLSQDDNWLLEEIETILNTRLPQQWLPGYEPDPNKPTSKMTKNSRSRERQRLKSKIAGKSSNNRRRRRR
jgi:superfamily II DNA/RNA helicase